MTDVTCEWCDMTYPKGGYKYWTLRVIHMGKYDDIMVGKYPQREAIEHIICDDCYKRLKERGKGRK